MLENDYIVRMITDIVRAIIRLILGKDIAGEELINEAESPVTYLLNQELIKMADNGDITGAEDRLYDLLNEDDMSTFELAMSFYLHINQYEENFLDKNNFSREEIKEGIFNILTIFGIHLDENILL